MSIPHFKFSGSTFKQGLAHGETLRDSIKKNIPLERFAEPSEIANLVTFLCSEKNSYITGQVVIIDGGYACK